MTDNNDNDNDVEQTLGVLSDIMQVNDRFQFLLARMVVEPTPFIFFPARIITILQSDLSPEEVCVALISEIEKLKNVAPEVTNALFDLAALTPQIDEFAKMVRDNNPPQD